MNVCIFMHVCMQICMYLRIYVSVCTCIYVYLDVCVSAPMRPILSPPILEIRADNPSSLVAPEQSHRELPQVMTQGIKEEATAAQRHRRQAEMLVTEAELSGSHRGGDGGGGGEGVKSNTPPRILNSWPYLPRANTPRLFYR